MRRIALATVAAAIACPAVAADVSARLVRKAAAVAPASGLYVGVGSNFSSMKEQVNWLTVPGFGTGGINPAGWGLNGLVGYRMWTGSGTFVAVEADGAYEMTRGGVACTGPLGVADWCSTKNSVVFRQLLKVGAPLAAINGAVPNALPSPSQWPLPMPVPTSLSGAPIAPYVAVGAVERDVNACVATQGCSRAWVAGWTTGAGVLMPVSSGWSIDFGVLYESFNKSFQPGVVPAVAVFPPATWKTLSGVRATAALVASF